jgi:YHS domain-containing protein
MAEGKALVNIKKYIMKNIYLILVSVLLTTISYAQKETVKFANADAPSQNIGEDSLAVSGYDLTEYFTSKKAIKGSSEYQFEYQGTKYLFLNEKNKLAFVGNPEKYLPQYGGYCAYGLGMDSGLNGNPPGKYPINPKTFKIINNKLYLFYNDNGYNFLEYWEKNENAYLKKADERWSIINE